MFLKQPDGQTPVAPKRGFPDMLLQLVGNGIILDDDLHAVCYGKIKHVSDWMITEERLRATLVFVIHIPESIFNPSMVFNQQLCYQRRGNPMAQKLDDSEIVDFKELLIANSIQTDALVQLLIEEGIFTEQKFFTKFKQVQAQYQKHESIR